MGTPQAAAAARTEYRLALGLSLEEITAQRVMQFGRRHGSVDTPSHQEVANVGIGLEEHGRREEHVVDTDDALFIELDVIDEWRTAMKREVQRVMKIMVEVGASTDEEVHQPPFHQLDYAPAKAGRRQGARDCQRDSRVMLREEHLVGKDSTGLTEPRGVERLKPFFDEMPDVGASAGPIVSNGLARQVIGS